MDKKELQALLNIERLFALRDDEQNRAQMRANRIRLEIDRNPWLAMTADAGLEAND